MTVLCACAPSPLRRQALSGDIAGALRSYRSAAQNRGASDPDQLAIVALAVLEREATANDLRVQRAALTSLRSLGQKGRDALARLSERDGILGDRAAAALYEVDGRDGEPPARLLEAARSTDPERRIAGLVADEGRGNVLALIGALESSSSELRRAAAQRLARRRGERAVIDRLAQCVREDPDDSVRAACVLSLGAHGQAAFDGILPAREDRVTFVRMMAITALVSANRDRAREVLAPMLREPPNALSIELARALSARGDEAATNYVFDALAGSDAGLRAQAAVAASGLGERHESRLMPFLEDADVEVRLRVAGALGRAGRRRTEAIAALRPLAASPDPMLAIRALLVLSECDDAAAAEPVRRALATAAPAIKRLAILAWSHLAGSSGEVDPLADLLVDADATVRVMAAGEIVRIASR
ncbi:MAG: HEAT repeat domain-containing protein [Myxococcales bacterium]|nr:HEAT repeat domain-containing protein [Myxococcales bacterium]